ENVVEMLKSLRGEGHPALWYLLLRAAYFVVGSPTILPLVSIAIAAAATLLLVLRSPFPWWMIALLLLSNFLLFEYSVMARNYGISVLLLFVLANYYPRYRDRGVLLGILLALLANTNAHSVLLVGAFLLLWLIDIVYEYGIRWTRALKIFLLNVAVSAVGIVACVATIYPTYNDAAVLVLPEGVTLRLVIKVVLLPAAFLSDIFFGWTKLGQTEIKLLMSLAMFGSLLGLIRSPGAFIAGLTALITLSLFFATIYPGGYRHHALWLVFLVSMYWITRANNNAIELRIPDRFKSLADPASAIGSTLMVLLLALQVYSGVSAVAGTAFGAPPWSRAHEFSAFVAGRSDLQDAIIIADPDVLVETLPYYIHNRTYLIRERRFGNVSKFTMKARLAIDLDDILATAKTLQAEKDKPILILLHQTLDASQSRIYYEVYNWSLLTTPEQVRHFLSSTRFIARFAPALTDESFDVYLFDQAD